MDGILLVDKPFGCSSFDVIRVLRRHLSFSKIGHAGTLDPAGTGLLILLFGRATKLSNTLTNAPKVYEGVIKLGEETNTYDAEGETTHRHPFEHITREQIEAEMKHFIGDQYQVPPMFSAKKIQGVPLYKLARQGKDVERKPHFISIFKFDLVDFQTPLVRFRVRCSKGTYVRSIAFDFGKRLNCGAHLVELRRLESGLFNVDRAVSLEKIKETPPSVVRQWIIPQEEICGYLQS